MNALNEEQLEQYYSDAESWSTDLRQAAERSRRLAWAIAGLLGLIALLEALALFLLVPLKRDVPYTLLVDRQTGYVEALRPFDEQVLTPDAALTRSFLVQYVTARESFDASTLQANYRKVGLMSAGDARESYLARMGSGAADNPVTSLPRGTGIEVLIRSISSLSGDTAMVRFDTIQRVRGGQPQLTQTWAAVIRYRYSSAEMSADDRLLNPLGFQVVRYRKDPETLSRNEMAGSQRAEPLQPVPGSAGR